MDSVCADSDIRRLNTTIVAGPGLAPQITASLTRDRRWAHRTCCGEILDGTETVPKWSRERRSLADLREAYQPDKAMRS